MTRLASSLVEAVWVLDRLEKPTIAAIHGYALGGGLELAMGADFRFLADDARVGQPEIKLGLIPGAGGTQRLQRLVGFQKAKEIVYTGRQVGAEEALAIGLADRVVSSDSLLEEAMKAAAEWAMGPTRALTAAKQALAEGHNRPLPGGNGDRSPGFPDEFLDRGRAGRGCRFHRQAPGEFRRELNPVAAAALRRIGMNPNHLGRGALGPSPGVG